MIIKGQFNWVDAVEKYVLAKQCIWKMIYHHKVEIIPETDNHVKGENTVVI